MPANHILEGSNKFSGKGSPVIITSKDGPVFLSILNIKTHEYVFMKSIHIWRQVSDAFTLLLNIKKFIVV